MDLLTLRNKESLKEGALKQVSLLKQEFGINPTEPVIADIGANVGYFSESFLHYYPNSTVHAYEPHPLHIQELSKLEDPRIILHPYGLFNYNGTFTIGMRDDGRFNNGTFGIFDKQGSIEVAFKNADEEQIRPDIVKIDVEGSESYILECTKFFSKTQAILIELLYGDNYGMNFKVVESLKNLGFVHRTMLGRNDHLWVKK